MKWEWFHDPCEWCEEADLADGMHATITTNFTSAGRGREGFDPKEDATEWWLYTNDEDGVLCGRFAKPVFLGRMILPNARKIAEKTLERVI